MHERQSFRIGEEAKTARVFSQEDVERFAELSGDHNPIHLDNTYAQSSFFQGRIVHGMLVASLISSILGNTLPGPGSIYLRQELQFTAPVHPGDEVTATVIVIDWNPHNGKITLSTQVTNSDKKVVISGEARLMMVSYITKLQSSPT